MREAKILILPGDGIGPEITDAAVRVLEATAAKDSLKVHFERGLIGGNAINETGQPLPDTTRAAAIDADAVLLGAVGGPKWDKGDVRPEQGLLAIRKALGLFANIRPVRIFPELAGASPLRQDLLDGVDFVVVRELTGGLYFGEPRYRRTDEDGTERAVDTLVYTDTEIERVARRAFVMAQARRKKVTSIDKANVLTSSKLWRDVVTRVAADYPDVELEHQLVDSAAMRLVTHPAAFDVIVTENLFGDILSDEAAVLTGSLGMLPSASLSSDGPGLFEPIHGSAPDIAGKGVANPLATILSAAMLLRHALGQADAAARIERAVEQVIRDGHRCADIAGGQAALSTAAMTEHVIAAL